MKKVFKKGFTLVELLIVIAIIAILAVIVISNVTAAKQKANDTKVFSDLSETQKAILQCIASDGTPNAIPTGAGAATGGGNVCSVTTTVQNTYPTLTPAAAATRIRSSNGAYWGYIAGSAYSQANGTFTMNARANAAGNVFDISCTEGGCTKTGF